MKLFKASKTSLKTQIIIGLITMAAYTAYALGTGGNHTSNFIVYICLFIIAGQGWNVFGGYIGEISFGHAVFFGIGAYTIGFAQGYDLGIPTWALVVMAPVVSGLFALVISYPVLRIKGFSFLIGTFGLGIIFMDVFKNLKVLFASKGVFITSIDTMTLYLIIVALTIAITILLTWLMRSNMGLKFIALRDAPEAAEMIGINQYRTKAVALVVSAMTTAIAGVMYALYSMHITPSAVYDPALSNAILLGPYIGGCGTIMGSVVGGTIIIIIEEWARGAISVSGGHNLILGILLIVVMMTMREGVWPTIVKLAKRLYLRIKAGSVNNERAE
jgi:branched-chain amino acid transport system permease protein